MGNLLLRLECGGLLVALVAACGSNESSATGAGDGGSSPEAVDASVVVTGDGGGPSGMFSDPVDDASTGAGLDASTGTGVGLDATSPSPDAGGMSTGADASAGSGSGDDGSTGSSVADASGLGVDSRAAYCAGSGPPVTVGDSLTGLPECTGAIAEWTFSHALCTCSDASVQGVFATDSFDSTLGTYQPGQAGAPVGVNRNFLVSGVPTVGGSLSVAGPGGLAFAGAATIEGDLDIAGDLSLAGTTQVARDLWVDGNLTSAGITSIGRDLHQPAGRIAIGLIGVGGATVSAPFTVAEPCACAPNELLDVGAIVSQGKTLNDNASVGLDPDALDAVVGAADIELPCGRFYLNQIAGAGAIRFGVPGRTALFVDGDIATAGVLDFDVGPAGELDVFVTGNLIPTGATTFGNVARPAAVRIYVGGSKDVLLTGADQFVGNIYAPRSNVVLTGYSDVYGSIFAGNFEAPGAVFIHYDRAVLEAGDECPPPPPPPPAAPDAGAPTTPVDAGSNSPPDAGSSSPPKVDAGGPATPDAGTTSPPPPPPPACQKCGYCSAGTACVATGCGACGSDSDCCAPLVCNVGMCGQLIPR
jgi:hypothetical protein